MPITAQDIHEAFLKARKENYTDKVDWGVAWEHLNAKEKLCYDCMAELLNSKVGQPQPVPSGVIEAPAMLELIQSFMKDHVVARNGDVCHCNFCEEGRAIARRIMEAK